MGNSNIWVDDWVSIGNGVYRIDLISRCADGVVIHATEEGWEGNNVGACLDMASAQLRLADLEGEEGTNEQS